MAWIDATVKPPALLHPVLVCWKQEGAVGRFLTEAILTHAGWRYTAPGSMLRQLPGVTHWMPLPEPPEAL